MERREFMASSLVHMAPMDNTASTECTVIMEQESGMINPITIICTCMGAMEAMDFTVECMEAMDTMDTMEAMEAMACTAIMVLKVPTVTPTACSTLMVCTDHMDFMDSTLSTALVQIPISSSMTMKGTS